MNLAKDDSADFDVQSYPMAASIFCWHLQRTRGQSVNVEKSADGGHSKSANITV